MSCLEFNGINTLSLLILLHYLYSDEVLTIWDRRIITSLGSHRLGMKFDANMVKTDLQRLSEVLDLPALQTALQAPVKRPTVSTLPQHLTSVFERVQPQTGSETKQANVPEALRPDVVLEFTDKEVWTHSTILRCRSSFFEGLFASDVWTMKRWGDDGVLRLNFRHLNWHVMQYVMRFLVCGADREMFEVLRE